MSEMEEIKRSADKAMEPCTETFTSSKCLCKITFNKDLFLQSSEKSFTPVVNVKHFYRVFFF